LLIDESAGHLWDRFGRIVGRQNDKGYDDLLVRLSHHAGFLDHRLNKIRALGNIVGRRHDKQCETTATQRFQQPQRLTRF
jgi:hypothetical protein